MKKRLVLVAMAMMVVLTAGVSAAASALAEKQVQQVQAPAAQTSIIEEDTGIIPSDAIRLRIIANSDDPKDQKLKRDVRDQIIAAIAVKVRGTENADEARAKISAAVPEMNKIAEEVIKEKGYKYPVKTDFGMVPFPTKLYGDQVYPAGNYEALRIQIGAAAGQNWWCVLFPPLCFVDMANGDAVAKPKDMPEHATKAKPLTTVNVMNASQGVQQKVEVRSALLDSLSNLWDKITAFFA